VNNTAAARADFTGSPTHANFFVFVFFKGVVQSCPR
jgi:hypothetical protein